MTNVGLGAATAWPTANKALYIPFGVTRPFTAYKFSAYVGTASGNIDVGIYDEGGTRLVSLGSTAAVTGTPDWNITDTVLPRGLYYMALAVDNTTFTVRAGSLNNNTALVTALGMAEQTTAFALPATATFAKVSQNYVPFLALSGRSVFT